MTFRKTFIHELSATGGFPPAGGQAAYPAKRDQKHGGHELRRIYLNIF
jgi:hypothetical protein